MRKFDMKRPCTNCPFRTDRNAIRFASAIRAAEIARSAFLFGFPCHTTADYFEDESDGECNDSGFIFGDGTQHCAGYLIMQLKASNERSWPGIGHDQDLVARLRATLDFDSPVFDNLDDFYRANQSQKQNDAGRDEIPDDT